MIRATLQSLQARKLRLVLSGLAVVLGTMAVSGAFVLSQTLTDQFGRIFQTIGTTLDVTVAGRPQVEATAGAEPVTSPVPDGVREQIAALPGVAEVTGQVYGEGMRVLDKNGEVITTIGPPGVGVNWAAETDLNRLIIGRAPSSADEVVINDTIAERGGFAVGDHVTVLTLQPARTFTIVGVAEPLPEFKRPTGDLRVAFTDEVAQELVIGQPGAWTRINIDAAEGVSPEELRHQVVAAVGDRYEVQTGAEYVTEQDAGIQEFVGVIRTVLLGFAAVALFVGVFLILNTFSILVAQRTTELALLRALGAGRGQVLRSVLAEALLVGVLASTVGFVAGIGVAVLLRAVMESLGGVDLPSGLSVPLSAVVATYAVGVLVTLAAALLPAVRAARIAPVAAMRAAAAADRPLTRLTVAGFLLAAAGGGSVVAALLGDLGDSARPALLGGVLLIVVGVTLLTPAMSRPVIAVLGRLASWSAPAKLGRRNSARNPRRTAITAAALMVGVTLVTGVSVLANSMRDSMESVVATDLGADLIVSGGPTGAPNPPGTFDPAVLDAAERIPGVAAAVAVHVDTAQVGPDAVEVAAGNIRSIAAVFGLSATTGELRELDTGELLVDEPYADDHGLVVGDVVQVSTQRGQPHPARLVGTFAESDLLPSVILPSDDAAGFRSPQASQGYITLAEGADAGIVQARVSELLADSPDVDITDRAGFAEEQTAQVDIMLVVLNMLIGLSILIAILGVVNTLTLSLVERRRELCLVRAVGMRRGQVIQMVTVESVVITVFGALLGIALGTGLGAAVVAALGDTGVPLVTVALPVETMLVLVGLAVLVGVAAAALPAVRASRVDVLRAIAYE